MEEGKTPVISDIENWNELIAKYNRTKTKDVLLIQESQFCSKEKINPQLYLAIKDILIREGTIRPLQKQDAIAMDPNHAEALSKIYDLLVSLRILTNEYSQKV